MLRRVWCECATVLWKPCQFRCVHSPLCTPLTCDGSRHPSGGHLAHGYNTAQKKISTTSIHFECSVGPRQASKRCKKKSWGAPNRGTDDLRLGGPHLGKGSPSGQGVPIWARGPCCAMRGCGWGVTNRRTVSVFSQTPRWRCWLCAIQSNFDIEAAWGSVWLMCFVQVHAISEWATNDSVQTFSSALMWSLAGCFDASGSFVMCVGMCLLEESPLVLSGWLVVCLTGVERQLSAP